MNLIRVGNPTLRYISKPFTQEEILNLKTKQLIENMIVIMKQNGGIGIAAPQVNISKRLIIIDVPKTENIREFQTIIFNPCIDSQGDKKVSIWEACLSVPGRWGYIARHAQVNMVYYDVNAKRRKIRASGFLAAILQHEHDHLMGKLFIDRIKDRDVNNIICSDEEVKELRKSMKDCTEGDWSFVD